MKKFICIETVKNLLRERITECILYGDNGYADVYRDCIDLLDAIDDVKPILCGTWIPRMFGTHECSICHNDPIHYSGTTGYVEILSEYCPNCGAKMSKTNEYDS